MLLVFGLNAVVAGWQSYFMATGDNYRKIMSGLFASSESKMTLDDMIKFLQDLKARGASGGSVVSLVTEVDGAFNEFGALGTVNINIYDGGSQLFINLKR
jgi:hypothetical protein